MRLNALCKVGAEIGHNAVDDTLFNRARLADIMNDEGFDAVVGHSPRNFYYLTGFESLEYAFEAEAMNYVLLPRDPAIRPAVTIPKAEYLALKERPTWISRRVFYGQVFMQNAPPVPGLTTTDSFEALVTLLKAGRLDQGVIAFELEHLPLTVYRRLTDVLPGIRIADASGVFRRLRMIKSPDEIRRVGTACEIAEEAIEEALTEVRPGLTEKDVSRLIASGIVSRGADVLYVVVASGETAGTTLPTTRIIEKGDLLRLDVAATYDQYNSDISRTVAVGSATQEARVRYKIAYEALQAGIAAARAGEKVEHVFQAAMAVYAEAGFSEIRRHHVGHGLGLQTHEPPFLRPESAEIVTADMVLAIEAPSYIYGLGGFAPEDVVHVTEHGNTRFSEAPAELPVIA